MLSTSSDPRSVLATLTRLLTDQSDFEAIPSARHAVATALNHLDQPLTRGPLTDELLATVESLARHPAGTVASTEAPLTLTRTGWAGTLVQMLAAPAWQTPGLRPLGDQPAWLWSTYARFLFTAPACFDTTEHATRWAAHIAGHLDALVRMLEGNRASPSVQAVARLALAASDHWPASDVGESLRQRRQHIGRLLTLLAPRLPVFDPAPTSPDDGTPLRVALIGEDFAHLKTHLDPERIALTHHPLADLPADIAACVQTLRDTHSDAVIFAGDLTRTDSPLTALALHRLAPLQFATALCPHTTGLPEIAIFLGDSSSSQDSHTERVAILPAALAFDSLTPLDESLPDRIDCLSFADALTSILESACRSPDAPLIATDVTCDLATRHEQGNHLLAFGRTHRAVVYLLAAVDDPQAGPDVWHDLALALHANGQPADAIQALETCVRIAPDRLDSWLLLSDWAADYGHHDLVRDIAAVVRELTPAEHPRVTALAS